MVAQKGSLMLIKVGDGAPSESFGTLGGLQVSSMVVNHGAIDASCLGSGQWRQVIDGGGLRMVSVEGEGIFTDTAVEERMRGYTFSGDIHNFRLYFGNGDYVQGGFIISRYMRSGTHESEEIYSVHLESAGDILFVVA